MRIPIIASLAFLFLSPAQGQELQRRPYHDWPIYQDTKKKLPPGFFHFRPVSHLVAEQRYDGGRFVVCREADDPANPVANAIAFAKRLYLGDTILQAIDKMSRAHGGEVPCGFNHTNQYSPTDVSVRGYDLNGETKRVLILKVRDISGAVFYMGVPD